MLFAFLKDTKDELNHNLNEITENNSVWNLNDVSKATSADINEELSITLRKENGMYNYQSEDYDIPSDDRKLLDKLCRLDYFNGGYHLEEIMYLENIRRSQLLQILDKFRDILITCECEDPAIALFYSQFNS